jgi:hypothetical protein
MATKTDQKKPSGLSQKQLAESEASLWLKLKKQEQDLKEKIKEVSERLHNYAADHRDEFGGKNTLRLGDVKLVYGNEGKVITGDTFDADNFRDAYPECVEEKISLSKLKGLMVSERLAEEIRDNFDVSIDYNETFKVEKA